MTSHISREQMITFLLETPFFEMLDPRELMEIIHIVEKADFKSGEVVFEEGATGDAWYIVYRGSVDVLNNGEKIAEIGQKSCFGEMSVLDKLPRSATIVANEDSVLLCVKSSIFNELVNEANPVAYKLIYEMAKLLSNRQRASTAKLSELLRDNNVDDVHKGIKDIVGVSTLRE